MNNESRAELHEIHRRMESEMLRLRASCMDGGLAEHTQAFVDFRNKFDDLLVQFYLYLKGCP